MVASKAILDMTNAGLKPNGKPVIDRQGRPPEKQGGRPRKSTNPKQIRSRARRARKLTDGDLQALWKPIEEWDHEELARGRPRDKAGGFRGRPPDWVTRAVHEQIVKQFETIVKTEMNVHTVKALTVLEHILDDESTDAKGRPLVNASTKLDAAKFLVEHILGKPKQRMETDISVKLQGLLGVAMVNPDPTGEGFALTQGYIDVDSYEEDVDERSSD